MCTSPRSRNVVAAEDGEWYVPPGGDPMVRARAGGARACVGKVTYRAPPRHVSPEGAEARRARTQIAAPGVCPSARATDPTRPRAARGLAGASCARRSAIFVRRGGERRGGEARRRGCHCCPALLRPSQSRLRSARRAFRPPGRLMMAGTTPSQPRCTAVATLSTLPGPRPTHTADALFTPRRSTNAHRSPRSPVAVHATAGSSEVSATWQAVPRCVRRAASSARSTTWHTYARTQCNARAHACARARLRQRPPQTSTAHPVTPSRRLASPWRWNVPE